MKKFISVIFFIAVCLIPAHGQDLLGALGASVLKSVGKAAGSAVMGNVTERIEAKTENVVTNLMNKTFGEIKRDTLTNEAESGFMAVGKMFVDVSSNLSSTMEKSQKAGLAALNDYSEQNAARKERNQSLVFDDWDI